MKKIYLLFSFLLLSSSLFVFGQSAGDNVEFYVIGYDNATSEFILVDGVEVYEKTEKDTSLLGTIAQVQSCGSQLNTGLFLKKKPGTYRYYAESGDGKNKWNGEYKVEKNEMTRIPLRVNTKLYQYQEGDPNALFFVLGYNKETKDWKHVKGVTVYDGNSIDDSKKLGRTSRIHSANPSGNKSELSAVKTPGTYSYVAVSGDGKQEWKGTYDIKKGERTKIALQIDFSKYE